MVIEKQLSHLMTVTDVAQLLNIHNNTVRRWSDRGVIKAYRINDRGDRRFKREEIVRFLSELSTR
jgi:excisionase family DNA binding protein